MCRGTKTAVSAHQPPVTQTKPRKHLCRDKRDDAHMFLTYHPAYRIIELVTVTVFTIDYLLRWITASYLDGLRNNQEEKEKV